MMKYRQKFRPPIKQKTFPWQYGSNLLSQASSNTQKYPGWRDGLDYDSIYHILCYKMEFSVPAKGTIILPAGTFNAILEGINITFYDSIMVKDSSLGWISYNSPQGSPYLYYQ